MTSSASALCSVCRELEGWNCSNCLKVRYCSTEHQKADWKRHKSDCYPAKVARDAVQGRYLVATRMITQGEMFLKEKPLLVGPSTSGRPLIVCLSCCLQIQRSRPPYSCSKCRWPVCDEKCEQAPQHAQFECSVYSKAGVRPSRRPDMDMENVKVLRGLLLKKTNPEKWEQLLQLESHTERRGADPDIALNTSLAVNHVQNQCGLEEFDVGTIQRIDGAINVNAMCSGDGDGINPRYGAYVYLNGSMANHSCTPNIRRIIQLDSTLNFQATVQILSGTPILTSYCYFLDGTLKRRANLSNYYFSCTCPRCADPTELGTHLSSVACQRCLQKRPADAGGGYLLPIDSLNADSDWKCATCGLTRTADDIRSFVGRIETEIDAVAADYTLASFDRLEALLKKHQGASLHPNNYLLISAEQDMAQRIDYILQEAADGTVELDSDTVAVMAKKQVDLCRRNLALVSVLWPGCCDQRGRLLFTRKGTPERRFDWWPHDRDSKFCNVHLFKLSVTSRFLGQKLVEEASRGALSELRFYTPRSFVIQVYGGHVREQHWACFPSNEVIPIPTNSELNAPLDLFNHGRSFHLRTIHVKDWGAVAESLDLRCPKEFYSPVPNPHDHKMEFNTFKSVCKVFLMTEKSNASVAIRNDESQLKYSDAKVVLEAAIFKLYHHPIRSNMRIDNLSDSLLYCQRELKRYFGMVHWLSAYDPSTWAVMVIFALTAALVSSVHVNGSGLHLNPDPFNILRLIQQDGTVRTKLHLGILVCSCVFLALYGNYMTSVAMAPSPPHAHQTVKAMLEDGYKIVWDDHGRGVTPEAFYKTEFERLNILHLITTSFLQINKTGFVFPPPGLAEILVSNAKYRVNYEKWMTRWHKFSASVSASNLQRYTTCHFLDDQFPTSLSSSWSEIHGLLRDEMVRWMQLIIQHGFLKAWEEMDSHYNEIGFGRAERQQVQESGGRESNDPPRVSMDFEIIMIFPVWGILLSIAVLVFLGELGFTFAIAWQAVKSGALGLGL